MTRRSLWFQPDSSPSHERHLSSLLRLPSLPFFFSLSLLHPGVGRRHRCEEGSVAPTPALAAADLELLSRLRPEPPHEAHQLLPSRFRAARVWSSPSFGFSLESVIPTFHGSCPALPSSQTAPPSSSPLQTPRMVLALIPLHSDVLGSVLQPSLSSRTPKSLYRSHLATFSLSFPLSFSRQAKLQQAPQSVTFHHLPSLFLSASNPSRGTRLSPILHLFPLSSSLPHVQDPSRAPLFLSFPLSSSLPHAQDRAPSEHHLSSLPISLSPSFFLSISVLHPKD